MFRCSQIYRPTTDYVLEDIRRESSIRRTSLSLAKNLTGKGEREKRAVPPTHDRPAMILLTRTSA